MAEHTKGRFDTATKEAREIVAQVAEYLQRQEFADLVRAGDRDQSAPVEYAAARYSIAALHPLASIPDPAAFVEAARGMREAMEKAQPVLARAVKQAFVARNICGSNTCQEREAIEASQALHAALTSFRAAMREGQGDE